MKVFNWIMIIITLISAIMTFLAPLYLTEKELKLIIEYFAFKN